MVDEIVDGAPFYALVLVLATLFTSELQRRLDALDDIPKPKRRLVKRVSRLAAATLLLTALSFTAMSKWGIGVALTVFRENSFNPTLAIFEIAWVMLIGLCAWQASIFWNSRELANSDRAVR